VLRLFVRRPIDAFTDGSATTHAAADIDLLAGVGELAVVVS
jgi:hypothetical protein